MQSRVHKHPLEMIPLTHYLASQRNPGADNDNRIFAHEIDRQFAKKDFYVRVAAWFNIFEPSPVKSWGVYTQDSFEFAAIVFALWHARKEVVVLGDNLTQTVVNVSRYANGLVGEFSPEHLQAGDFKGQYLSASHARSFALTDIDETASVSVRKRPVWEILDEHSIALCVFTSGSTGEPKKIAITFAQLDREIASHESRWGHQLGSGPIAATVSHQHLYGLIFKVLWPISAQRPFINRTISVIEDLARYADSLSPLTLITTPSHLSRLPETMDWKALGACWAKVFSSAAPLNLASSIDAKRKFGIDVTEVYGSSETGGIAWREQTSSTGDVWHCFECLRISQEKTSGVLKLSSPFLPTMDWYATADKVELINETQFRLLGRIDRIAKVEGKRISLTAIEQHLVASALVKEARVITISDNRVTGNRVLTGVVIALSDIGKEALNERGRKPLLVTLKALLRQSFEAVVVPRKWRFVEELPHDLQGKVTQQKLLELFDKE